MNLREKTLHVKDTLNLQNPRNEFTFFCHQELGDGGSGRVENFCWHTLGLIFEGQFRENVSLLSSLLYYVQVSFNVPLGSKGTFFTLTDLLRVADGVKQKRGHQGCFRPLTLNLSTATFPLVQQPLRIHSFKISQYLLCATLCQSVRETGMTKTQKC